MKANSMVFGALLLAGAGARAQLAEAPAAPVLETEAGRFGPLAAGFKRYSPLYGGNETANPNDRVFQGFRTDPRLVLGYALNDYLSVETGYSHLADKGFHKIEPGPVESAVAAGALGARSNTTYVAARVTLPVTERLSAYGKFGVAHSVVKNDGLLAPQRVRSRTSGEFLGESGTGPYTAVGAEYKLGGRAKLSGEAVLNGSAGKFGKASNASGIKASVGVGF
jgi:opacity protein-like surface antigen